MTDDTCRASGEPGKVKIRGLEWTKRRKQALGATAAIAVVASVLAIAVSRDSKPALAAEPLDLSQALVDNSRAGTYLGSLDGDDKVFVAITTDEGRVKAYVCDGEKMGVWFSGALYGNSFDLTHQSGARISGAIGNGASQGTFISADGRGRSFSAALPLETGGLFMAADQLAGGGELVAGWIIHDDGEVRGVVTTRSDETATPVTEAAPAIVADEVRDLPTATLDTGPVPVAEVTPEALTGPTPTAAPDQDSTAQEGGQGDDGGATTSETGADGTEVALSGGDDFADAPPSDTPPNLATRFEPAAVLPGATADWVGQVSNPGKTDLVGITVGVSFPAGITIDDAPLTVSCDKAAVAETDPKLRLPDDPQLVVSVERLAPGELCEVRIPLVVQAGAFDVVTAPPVAVNAKGAGPVAVARVAATDSAPPADPGDQGEGTEPPVGTEPEPIPPSTVIDKLTVDDPKETDRGSAPIEVEAEPEAGPDIAWEASASLGISPLSVTLSPGKESPKLESWSVVFSDGTGQVSGTGPLVEVPHTFQNDGKEAVVFHADLLAVAPGGGVTRARLSFNVLPEGQVDPMAIATPTKPLQRGDSGGVTVTLLNPASKALESPTLTFSLDPSLPITGSGEGWKCDGSRCDSTNVAPGSSSAPLTLQIGPLPDSAPPTLTLAVKGSVSTKFELAVEGLEARAGEDQTVEAGTTVILDASGSTSAPGRPRTFKWRQTSGPKVDLKADLDPSGQRATFVAPSSTANTTATFEVTVTDAVSTSTDEVNVTILRANQAPTVSLAAVGLDTGDGGVVVPSATATEVRFAAEARDPDGDPITLAWSVPGTPEAQLSAEGDQARLAWPVPANPTVTVEVKATDSLGRVSASTLQVGKTPNALTLAVDAPADAPAGSVVKLVATPSRRAGVEVSWAQVSGPSGELRTTTGSEVRYVLPVGVIGTATVVLRATATASDSTVSRDITITATQAPPLTVVLKPSQDVDKGATVKVKATVEGPRGGDIAWTQIAGPTVTFTNGDKAEASFKAPNALSAVVVRVTVTAGSQVAVADQVVNVGSLQPVAEEPDSACAPNSVLRKVFDGQSVLLLGSASTVILGDVEGATGDCRRTELPFEGTSMNLFNVILGDDLAGTIDADKMCVTRGTVTLVSKFDLPPLEIGAVPLCLVFDRFGRSAPNNLTNASERSAPSVLTDAINAMLRGHRGAQAQSECESPVQGDLRWPGEVPFVNLPPGFTARETALVFGCDDMNITASVDVAGSGTLSFDGTLDFEGSGTVTVTAQGVSMFGGTIDGEIRLDVAGGTATARGELGVDRPDLGVPGLSVERIGLAIGDGTFEFSGTASIGDDQNRLDLELGGVFTSADNFALTVQAATNGSWTPVDGLTIGASSIGGSITRSGSNIEFEISGSASGSWRPVPGLAINEVTVTVTNSTKPEGCAALPAGALFISAGGAATIEVPNLQPINVQIEACVGLPDGSSAQPVFSLRSVGAMSDLRPDPSGALVIQQVELRAELIDGEIEVSLRGDARVMGLTLSARVVFKSSETGDVLVVVATGDVSSLGTPVATGTVIFATGDVNDFPIGPDVTFDVRQGLTLVSTIDLAADQAALLNQILKPPTPIAGRLTVSATLGGPTIAFTAAISLGADGITLFQTCPTAPCSPSGLQTTRFQLDSAFLRLVMGPAGFQLGIGGNGTLFLPPAETGPGAQRSEIQLTLEASFRPPAELGVSFSLLSSEGWRDAAGIKGLTVNALTVQGTVDFTVPTAPVPSIAVLAEVSRLPDGLADAIGFTNNGEPVRLALNIAPKNPIVEVTIGSSDDRTVMAPLAAIDGDDTELDESFAVDQATVVFAPLGGAIGPVTFNPGVSLRFDSTILGTDVEVAALVDIPKLRILANVSIGRFEVGNIQINNTQLHLDLQPLGARIRIAGGATIPDGPSVNAVFDLQAGVLALVDQASAPPPSTAVARPTVGIHAVADLTASAWDVAPGTRLTAVKLHAEGALDAVEATLNATFEAEARATVMGRSMAFEGTANLKDGEITEVHLRVNPGTVTVAGLTLGGDGTCQPSLVAAPTAAPVASLTSGAVSRGVVAGVVQSPASLRGITATTAKAATTTSTTSAETPRLGNSGPCFQLDYMPGSTPPVAIGFNGELTVSGIKVKARAMVDSRKADLQGTARLGQLGELALTGTLYHGTNADLAGFRTRVRDEAATVVPTQGSFRVEGRFTQGKALNGFEVPWSFSAGSVDPDGSRARVTWAMLDGSISRPGFNVTVKGDITQSGSSLTYSLVGTSAAKVDQKSIVLNPNPDPIAAPGPNTLHGAVRPVVFALDPTPASHQRGLEQVRGTLIGQASYQLSVELRHDKSPKFSFAGDARVDYVEGFKRGSAKSFTDESQASWNHPVNLVLSVNSTTGRACYRWGDPGDFSTIEWGSCP